MATIAVKQKVFTAHAAPQGGCDNLINAHKLFANQQAAGDSLVEMLVVGLPRTRQVKDAAKVHNGGHTRW